MIFVVHLLEGFTYDANGDVDLKLRTCGALKSLEFN